VEKNNSGALSESPKARGHPASISTAPGFVNNAMLALRIQEEATLKGV